MTEFNPAYGTAPAFVSATEVADSTLLFSSVPAYGAFKRVAVTAPIAKRALIKANGTLATASEPAVGVTNVAITAAQIAAAVAASEIVYVTYATSGNFRKEALVLDATRAANLTAANANMAHDNIVINEGVIAAI